MAYNSYNRENKFQELFLSECRKHGAYAVSLVGSVYQSGQPDCDIISTKGAVTKVELKVFRLVEVPTREKVLKLLHGPQINIITNQMWRRDANVLVIAQIGAKLDSCCIVSKHGFTIDFLSNTIKVLATLPFGERPPY